MKGLSRLLWYQPVHHCSVITRSTTAFLTYSLYQAVYRNCVPPGFKYYIYCKEIITQDIVDLIAKKRRELVFNDWRKITKKIAFYEDILHRYTDYKVRVLVVAFEILHLLFCNFLCVFYAEISICSNYIQWTIGKLSWLIFEQLVKHCVV